MSEERAEYRTGNRRGLLDDIKRARDAMHRGGPDGETGLVIASLIPSAWELADKIIERDPDTTEAEALEMGAVAREAILDTLERELTKE